MAFAVVCKSCQARFLLNDDLLRRKVAGKVVTVRCRQCHATIEVDASDVDPQALPEVEKPVPPPKLSSKGPKPAPAPPRPTARATLMGIGSPVKAGAATELVALSPGFLNMSAPAPSLHGFPEPPPLLGAAEDLSSGDWEITETTLPAKTDTVPESVDDFVEELPPSLPHPDDEMPSSTGTPSLKALTHHEEHATKPRGDDFLANMTAAMNGGIMSGGADGAPTIDISTLTRAPAESSNAPSIDVSDFDVRLEGKKTLPLFALGGDDDAIAPATPRAAPARPRPPSGAASLGDGSLSPAALDRPERDAERPAGPRERKNVVAPASKSVPPPAGQRRSGLAAPVLLALAIAAGFLIWRRSGAPGDLLAWGEPPPHHIAEAPPAAALLAAEPVAPMVAPSAAGPTPPADDITFETTPMKPATTPVAAHDKPTSSPDAHAATDDPAVTSPTPADPKPEPAQPIAKEEPKTPVAPTEPGEPAGPFDRAAAAAALSASAAQASACRKDGDPSGVASVVITFAPSGRVTSANVSGPPFAGTPTGSCIAAALRKARVPAFDGERVTVSKTIAIQ